MRTSNEVEELPSPPEHTVKFGIEGRGVQVAALGAESEVGRVVDDGGEGVVAEGLDQLAGITCTCE